MNDIFIGVISHKTAYFPNIPFHFPVCAGAYKNKIEYAGIQYSDNTGENITAKNPYYNELTAQYWMWKNIKEVDYIGLCHYRRYFNFDKKGSSPRIPEINTKNKRLGKKYGWNQEQIVDTVSKYDVIVPKKTARCSDKMTNGQLLGIKTELVKTIIQEIYPEYYPYFWDVCNERKIHSFNMFIMKTTLFHEYSEWLFNILSQFEIEYSKRMKGVMGRSCGELGEYLINVWLNYQMDKQNLRVLELQSIMFYDTEVQSSLKQRVNAIGKYVFMKCFPYGSKRHELILYKWFFK